MTPLPNGLTFERLKDLVAAAGIVGMGGGGFPTHWKLRPDLAHVVVNGAECEPLLDCDYFTLQHHFDEVLEGAGAVAAACGRPAIHVAVKRKNASLLLAPEPGGRRRFFPVLLEDAYPSGDELFVIRAALGQVLPAGVIPAQRGIMVGNVSTFRAIARALRGEPLTRRYVSVAGAVARPGTFDVPVGVRFGDLVEACGGTTEPDCRLIEGGVLMGALASADDVVRKTTSAVIALPEGHPAVLERVRPLARSVRLAESACCQCALCSEACSRRLLGHDIAPHRIMRLVGSARDYSSYRTAPLFNCSGCGLCSLVACPFGISPRRLILEARKNLARPPASAGGEPAAPFEGVCHGVPTASVYRRLGLRRYQTAHRFAGEIPRPPSLTVPLRQHAGKIAIAVVSAGEKVEAGQLLGRPAPDGPSAAVHAPAGGLVAAVTEQSVELKLFS